MADNITSVTALSGETSATTIYIPSAQTVTYSITGGADQGLFTLGRDNNQLPSATRLSFSQRPDFAHPTDAGGDNVYEVEVTAAYGGITQATLYKIAIVPDDYRGDASTTTMLPTDGTAVSGRINAAGDRDWFRVVSDGSPHLLIMHGVGGYEIFNADGSSRESMGSSQSLVIQFLNLPAGAYFFSVGGASYNSIPTGDYTVSLSPSAGGSAFGSDGDDTRTGTAFADFLVGNGGNDVLNGAGGNDVLDGGVGDDILNGGDGSDLLVGRGGANKLDGGNGYDVAIFTGQRSSYVVTATKQGWEVRGADSLDVLTNIEALEFSDKLAVPIEQFIQIPAALSAQITSILRGSATSDTNAALAARLASGLATNDLSAQGALQEIVKAAGASTSVATLSYEFFTGKIPGSAGIDYLVSPTGPNANNLNGVYYQSFNLENRYINFAVNLGKVGEGNANFSANYGSLSLFDATRKAYAAIFGGTPTDAKVHALIDSRVDYFSSYGGDGASGIGTKAAMVGWLLAEAVKADLGVMARSNDAWLADLSDGSAPFAIDILDPAKGYYKADFIFGG